MKNKLYKIGIAVFALMLIASGCEDRLTELNQNPNGVPLAGANANLLMPTVLGSAASRYLDLGVNNMAGAMQHTQKSGWAGGHNYYAWDGVGWENYYDILRSNELLIEIAQENSFSFHEGVGLTMRAFVYGQIADYWGDAPYEEAGQGDEGLFFPTYSSQETIYNGVIADLQAAATLFAADDDTGVDPSVDLYFGGDNAAWERFANSLIIRYAVRISEKSTASRGIVEGIVSGGRFITTTSEDATLNYTGGSNDQWPIQYDDEQSSTRYQACATLIDALVANDDPRLSVWFDPVRVRWVPNTDLDTAASKQMRINGGDLTDILPNWVDYLGSSDAFTREFDPDSVALNDSEYVGIPAGIFMQDVQAFNGNPNPGQGRHNVHVSMLTETFMDGQASPEDNLLQARLVSAAEMHFTLAEMAINGWNVGNAEEHYNAGVLASLETWGVEDEYDDFIAVVSYDGTVEQVITQKWIASFTSATESWNDYKRTGFPNLSVGEGAIAPVPAIRFGYGSDEVNNNGDNLNAAVELLEISSFSGSLGKASPYSKTWVLQGTGLPY